jgi:hypothetical protein
VNALGRSAAFVATRARMRRYAGMPKPVRIQLSRAQGVNLQAASLTRNGRKAVVVSRPGRWGNPWKVSDGLSPEVAVARYRAALLGGRLDFTVKDVRAVLGGRNLACWCPSDAPCHGDVLLAIANEER